MDTKQIHEPLNGKSTETSFKAKAFGVTSLLFAAAVLVYKGTNTANPSVMESNIAQDATVLGSCEVNESKSIWGPGQCVTVADCKGDRWCDAMGSCVGKSNCGLPTCVINEYENQGGPGACSSMAQCRGERYCDWNFQCAGISYCPYNPFTEVPGDPTIGIPSENLPVHMDQEQQVAACPSCSHWNMLGTSVFANYTYCETQCNEGTCASVTSTTPAAVSECDQKAAAALIVKKENYRKELIYEAKQRKLLMKEEKLFSEQKKDFKKNAPGLCKKRAAQQKDKVKNAAIKPTDIALGTGGMTIAKLDAYCAEYVDRSPAQTRPVSGGGAPPANNCKSQYGQPIPCAGEQQAPSQPQDGATCTNSYGQPAPCSGGSSAPPAQAPSGGACHNAYGVPIAC